MIRVGSVPKSTEVSNDELERRAAAEGAVIDLPGNRAGWAYLVLPNGERFRSWLNAPELPPVMRPVPCTEVRRRLAVAVCLVWRRPS